jgi:hypothetical protein
MPRTTKRIKGNPAELYDQIIAMEDKAKAMGLYVTAYFLALSRGEVGRLIPTLAADPAQSGGGYIGRAELAQIQGSLSPPDPPAPRAGRRALPKEKCVAA